MKKILLLIILTIATAIIVHAQERLKYGHVLLPENQFIVKITDAQINASDSTLKAGISIAPPSVSGQVLASNTAGEYYWTDNGSGTPIESFFELDAQGNIRPKGTLVSDTFFELDSFGNIRPKP